MKHLVEVVVFVEVRAKTPLALRMALAALRNDAPHVEQSSAGHAAGFRADGYAKEGHDYSYHLKSRRRAKSVKVIR